MADQTNPAQVTPAPTFAPKPTETAPAATPAVTTDGQTQTPTTTPETPAPAAGDAPKTDAAPEGSATKETESPKDERVVPERYELKLPEDTYLDQRSLERLESYAKTNKLTQDEAAALVKAQDQDVRAAMEERKQQFLAETKADRELGGENLQKNVEIANRFLDKYMGAELRADLDRTGYGNNKHFLKFILDQARRSSNDQAVMPGQSGSVPQKSAAELLYGPNK